MTHCHCQTTGRPPSCECQIRNQLHIQNFDRKSAAYSIVNKERGIIAKQKHKTRVPVHATPPVELAYISVPVIDNNNDDTGPGIHECCHLSPCTRHLVWFTFLTDVFSMIIEYCLLAISAGI